MEQYTVGTTPDGTDFTVGTIVEGRYTVGTIVDGTIYRWHDSRWSGTDTVETTSD